MRETVSRIAESIRAKIMAGDVRSEAAESACKACPLEGRCELVQCGENAVKP